MKHAFAKPPPIATQVQHKGGGDGWGWGDWNIIHGISQPLSYLNKLHTAVASGKHISGDIMCVQPSECLGLSSNTVDRQQTARPYKGVPCNRQQGHTKACHATDSKAIQRRAMQQIAGPYNGVPCNQARPLRHATALKSMRITLFHVVARLGPCSDTACLCVHAIGLTPSNKQYNAVAA